MLFLSLFLSSIPSFLPFLLTVSIRRQPCDQTVTGGQKDIDIFTLKARGCCLNYEWQKQIVVDNDFTTVQQGRIFRIAEVQNDDAGKYKCRVTSSTVVGGGGEIFSNVVTLAVGKCIHL